MGWDGKGYGTRINERGREQRREQGKGEKRWCPMKEMETWEREKIRQREDKGGKKRK